MDDTAGKEKITIHGQYDMGTTVEHDQTNTVNNDFTETIKKNATISITEGKFSHDVVAGTATYHVQGAIDGELRRHADDDGQEATSTIDVDGRRDRHLGRCAAHRTSRRRPTSSSTCGASKIWMDAGGQDHRSKA